MTAPAAYIVPGDPRGVVPVIYDESIRYHQDPTLAVATALQESGLDPQAVGDQGTSFGLFQLHRGGELGSLTPTEAFDPRTNAAVALQTFERTEAKYGTFNDPGALAAASQRPADRVGYAQAVDSHLQDAESLLRAYGLPTRAGTALDPALAPPSTTTTPGAPSTQPVGFSFGSILDPGGVFEKIWGGIKTPFQLAGAIWGFLTSSSTWIRVGLVVGGFVIVLIGIKALVS